MSKDLNHIENELDAKLREKYAKYTVQPDEALWNSINGSRVADKKLGLAQTKIKWLRVASIVFAFGFLGLLANQVIQHCKNLNNETGDRALSSLRYPDQFLLDSKSGLADADSLASTLSMASLRYFTR